MASIAEEISVNRERGAVASAKDGYSLALPHRILDLPK